MNTPTNKLLSLGPDDVSASDLLRLWSQAYGGDVAVTLGNLAAWLATQTTATGLVTQYEAPTATGFSVTLDQAGTWLLMTPDADYASGTIIIPTATDGQEVLVTSTRAVTALTVSAPLATMVAPPTTIAANGYFRLRYDASLKRWYRVG